ncbi:MAG: type II toxin-antitoxin system VapC family toxin [Lachnospiraceae bacterium]|nr:type II toxin-antitoxin system VapC family toxin [Lachnospiraceae bacterium]
MNYLIDTCAFIWSLGDSPELSSSVRQIIKQGKNLYLSQTTLWEIAIKKTIKKLNLAETTYELEQYCYEADILILPIINSCFETIQSIPYIHGDPFDRLIIATAIENDLTIITRDNILVNEIDCRYYAA